MSDDDLVSDSAAGSEVVLEPASDATRLEHDFPVSYAIFAMARSHRAVAGALLAELGLFPNQEIMLVQLGGQDGLSQKSLARTLRVDHSTVAKSVNRMEKAGLVQRRRSDHDGRVSQVHLTPAGRAIQEQIMAAWARLDASTTTGLTSAEQDQFLALAKKILPTIQRIEQGIGEPAGPPVG